MDFINDIIDWFHSKFDDLFSKKKRETPLSKDPGFAKKAYSQSEVPDLYDIPETLALHVMKWFVSGGISLEGAAALVGNLWRESYLNPAQLQIVNGKPKGPGKGLAQWTDSALTADKKDDGNQRWDEYLKFFQGLKASNPYWKNHRIMDAQPQLAFIHHELKNNFPGVWRVLTTPGSVSDKSTVVLKKYEISRDRDKKEEQNIRAKLSEKVYDLAKKDSKLRNKKNLKKTS